MTARALEGIRVVEFADEIASYCGRLLADLGADVIKIEPPGGGRLRNSPPFATETPSPDASIAFWVHNMSKKSVVLDLEVPADRVQAVALADSANVVLEDMSPGALAAKGLGFDDLIRANPALVYTSVTGFGQDGPHAGYAYSDIVGQAMGGLMTLAGDQADPPNLIYGRQADVSASIQAAQGTLMAVLHAEATGEGQRVEVSAQEAVSMSQETAMQTWDLQKTNRARTGERGMIPIALPGMGVYKTLDGYVTAFIMAPAGADFPALVDWMREEGKQQDLDSPEYQEVAEGLNMAMLTQAMSDPSSAAGLAGKIAHLNDVVAAFLSGMSATAAYEEGQARRLLFGIVSTPADLAENRQLRERGWYQTVTFGAGVGDKEFPGPPYRLSATPAQIGPPPLLGQHNEEVLAGLSSKER